MESKEQQIKEMEELLKEYNPKVNYTELYFNYLKLRNAEIIFHDD